MKDYYKLKAEKERISNDLKLAQRWEHQRLRERYPRWFKTLDILLIIAFVSNVGAYLATKTLIAATTPEVRVVEANPATATTQDLPTSKESNKEYWRWLLHFALLAGLLGFMWYQRSFMISYWHLWLYTGVVGVVVGVFVLDLLNNLALLAGVLLR